MPLRVNQPQRGVAVIEHDADPAITYRQKLSGRGGALETGARRAADSCVPSHSKTASTSKA